MINIVQNLEVVPPVMFNRSPLFDWADLYGPPKLTPLFFIKTLKISIALDGGLYFKMSTHVKLKFLGENRKIIRRNKHNLV